MRTEQNAYPSDTEPARVLVVDDSRADCLFVSSEVKRLVPGAQVESVSEAAEFCDAP
jgi:hypothetical protein